jgi:hypothetical protein
MDSKDAYEQIRIIPEHVDRSIFTMPDRMMVSQVLQMGDCNTPATYQGLMNHIFSPYLGMFMDVYLNDIVIYSDMAEEHMWHVKLVLDILKKEKLYLSRTKLHLFEKELKLLRHLIDNEGVRMDPEKVNNILKWKTPTNRDLLHTFLGAAGYLANNVCIV